MLFGEGAVPIPTQPGSDGQIGFDLEMVLNEQTGLVGAIISIGFAIQKYTASGSTAKVSGQEVWKGCKGKVG